MYLLLVARAGVFMDCSGSADQVNKYVSMMSAVAVIGILSAPPAGATMAGHPSSASIN